VASTKCSNRPFNLQEDLEVEDLHQEEEASMAVVAVVEDHQEEALHPLELLELHMQP